MALSEVENVNKIVSAILAAQAVSSSAGKGTNEDYVDRYKSILGLIRAHEQEEKDKRSEQMTARILGKSI